MDTHTHEGTEEEEEKRSRDKCVGVEAFFILTSGSCYCRFVPRHWQFCRFFHAVVDLTVRCVCKRKDGLKGRNFEVWIVGGSLKEVCKGCL